MKNISTGFGLCVAAAAALAYPFVSSLAPSANASAVTAAALAVSTAATAQTAPTIVWYGVTGTTVWRAWNTGRVEATSGNFYQPLGPGTCYSAWNSTTCGWIVISDPAQGLTYRSDINFDEKVDGADLGQLLADWGNAPRQDIPPSDCPLALINP
jgi:hypothetical protein